MIYESYLALRNIQKSCRRQVINSDSLRFCFAALSYFRYSLKKSAILSNGITFVLS